MTPAERQLFFHAVDWAKRVFAIGKRVATLEARVLALEDALGKQPADACHFCGERAMRKTASGHLMGDQGRQWWQDVWTCEKCGKTETRNFKLF